MPPTIPIGDLRHRVALQHLTRTPDGGGGYTETWAVLDTVPAAVEPAQAGQIERIFGAKVQAPTTHLVTLRFFPGLTVADRIVFKGRTFQIRGLQNPLEINRWWLVAAEELSL